jgi:hypothetical protein
MTGETYFASTEQLLVAYLSTVVPGVGDVGAELGDNPTYPAILVTRIPSGGHNGITESAVVDVDVFDRGRDAAEAFSRVVGFHMTRLRHTLVNVVLVDNVTPINGFGWIDYQDPPIERYLASYTIESRITAQPL